jgi:predicted 3-demethylubiquinone-9 3-methyltransferase (glyoxalase superfamily)
MLNINRYGKNEMGREGSIQLAGILMNGKEFMLIDTPVKNDFTFTPAMSIYVMRYRS